MVILSSYGGEFLNFSHMKHFDVKEKLFGFSEESWCVNMEDTGLDWDYWIFDLDNPVEQY